MFCNHEFQKDFEDLVKDNMVNKKTCARNNLVIKVSRSFIAHCKACERRIFLVCCYQRNLKNIKTTQGFNRFKTVCSKIHGQWLDDL